MGQFKTIYFIYVSVYISLSVSLFLSPLPHFTSMISGKRKELFYFKKLQKSEITTDQMDTIKVAQNSVFRKGLTIMNIQNIQYLWLRITQFVSSDSVNHNLFIKSIILVTQSMACTCIIFIKTLTQIIEIPQIIFDVCLLL